MYTVCRALVPSCGLCRIFALKRTMNTQCAARLFFRWLMSNLCFKNEACTVSRRLFLRVVAYVGSLLKERGIHSV